MRQSERVQNSGITKKGTKVSKAKASGKGERLGITYRLEDGTMVYVNESK